MDGVTPELDQLGSSIPGLSGRFRRYGLAWWLGSWHFSGVGILPVHQGVPGKTPVPPKALESGTELVKRCTKLPGHRSKGRSCRLPSNQVRDHCVKLASSMPCFLIHVQTV